ncbi:hypothetical protein ABZZ74_33735 [Streptomyces sp. NPDC006476]|uniref:hypothetical protein n=1 Tax=Streptomyces sp. NPDC006476 TaxID=3157175 RepID=UPI0033B1654F
MDLRGLRPDEVLDQSFYGLEFGLPTEKLRETIRQCVESGKRGVPLPVPAVNRLGRRITCQVQCSLRRPQRRSGPAHGGGRSNASG